MSCQTPSPVAFLFQGIAGAPGPVVSGPTVYAPGTAYFQNTAQVSVVSSNGNFWKANNLAKNALTTWGTPTMGSGDWVLLGPTFPIVANQAAIASGFVSSAVNLTQLNALYLGLWTAYASFPIPAIAAAAIPIISAATQLTDNSLIFFGPQSGATGFLATRFAQTVAQPFDVSIAGALVNTNGSAATLTTQPVYRTRVNAGAFGAWVAIGTPQIAKPNAESNFSQSQIVVLSGLTAGTDVQFGFQYGGSVATPANVSITGGTISVAAYNA